jgi:uncharacterized protein GlcG (DUF336 family)
MFAREVIGLKEAQKAVEVILEEASKNPNRPVAAAVVDHQGEIVCFARMDGATAMFNTMALKKARSSVTTGMNTRAWFQFLEKRNYTGADFVPEATRIPGGTAIVKPSGDGAAKAGPGENVVYGGIGVSGLSGNEDEALSLKGLEVIQALVWGQSS